MANQYTSLTKANIERKMKRKRKPVTSVSALAREFGYDVRSSAPGAFKAKVKTLIGESAYNNLRRTENINVSYR